MSNSIFELTDSCSQGSHIGLGVIEPWFVTYSSPDFFHFCFDDPKGVPVNTPGVQTPLLGRGYIGLYSYATSQQIREYMTTPLIEPLVAGVDYHLSFWVSRSDSCWYATKNLAAFVSESVPEANLGALLSIEEQVKYEGDTFLVSSSGWSRIAGSFTANGGEQYLTIGNFDDDVNTDTLFIPGGGAFRPGQPFYWSCGYYYVDGVTLVPDSIYLSNNDIETPEPSFNLYPNPNAGDFVIDLQTKDMDISVVHVWSITGQEVTKRPLINGQNSLKLNVSSGLYLYTVAVNGVPKWTGKLSISSN